MPTRTLPSSRRAHSWSCVYRRSSGTFMGGDDNPSRTRLTQDLADAAGVLLGQTEGVGIARPLGPDVGDGLVRVGEHERPPGVVDDLHPVDQHQLLVLAAFHQ